MRIAPILLALAVLAACQQPPSDTTPFSTPSQARPEGVPQAVVSDGDLEESGDI